MKSKIHKGVGYEEEPIIFEDYFEFDHILAVWTPIVFGGTKVAGIFYAICDSLDHCDDCKPIGAIYGETSEDRS